MVSLLFHTLQTILRICNSSRVAKPYMVNRKSRQRGFVGMILKVITLDDQIYLFNLALYSSLVRWLTRNAIGICLDLVIVLFGIGGETVAFGKEVTSSTAVRIWFSILSQRTGLCALSLKGMARSFSSILLNHSSSIARSIFTISAAGKAS
jgi:hypothetical protein